MEKKIKVCYICEVSNSKIREALPLSMDFGSWLMLKKNNLPVSTRVADLGVWNTNAINEFEKLTDIIELHVIAHQQFLKLCIFYTVINSIHYHLFRSIDDTPFRSLFNKITRRDSGYKNNRKTINGIIKKINPDVIHLIGAEIPSFGTAILDVPQSIPVLVQLQTLMNDPKFRENYPIGDYQYGIRSAYEMAIMKRADFIGTMASPFIEIIKKDLLPNAIILNTTLPLTEPVNLSICKKDFDFVYFAANISKAADWAIEAFIIASMKHPGIKLDVVGECSTDMKAQLVGRLSQYGIEQYVTFEGKLPTHEDVLNQIRKSRFAIIPMKIDLLTGTVRECMANGIPTVTTITPSSPKMNEKRQSLLLSEKGDFQSMADNMCRLLEDEQLAETIRQNAGLTASERSGNREIVLHWVETYRAILENKRNGTPIPDNFCVN